MTAQIAAYGRLVDDPQVKQTSKGTPMTLARMAVPFRAARQMTERRRCGYPSWHLADRPKHWKGTARVNS